MRYWPASALLVLCFGGAPAWGGAHYGLGSAVADQGAKAITKERAQRPALNLPACTDEPLTVTPLDLSTGFNIEPLGHLAPYGHTFPTEHIYFIIMKSSSVVTNSNVYAPSYIAITQIAASEYLNASPPFIDYSVRYSVCDRINGYFLHIREISASITSQAGAIDGNCSVYPDGSVRYCSKDVVVYVNAGDVIGTVTGDVGSSIYGLDVGFHDLRTPALAFANPSRRGTDQLHTVCAADYFPESIRSTLRSRMGAFDGSERRTAEPLCGEYNQDMAGTAQGNWYVSGTPAGPASQENAHLALVHDNVHPSTGVFSVGQSVSASGLSAGPYRFMPVSTGFVQRDFNGVTADGSVYCYDSFSNLLNSIILIQMPSATTLKIERQATASCGAGPWALTSNATDFVR